MAGLTHSGMGAIEHTEPRWLHQSVQEAYGSLRGILEGKVGDIVLVDSGEIDTLAENEGLRWMARTCSEITRVGILTGEPTLYENDSITIPTDRFAFKQERSYGREGWEIKDGDIGLHILQVGVLGVARHQLEDPSHDYRSFAGWCDVRAGADDVQKFFFTGYSGGVEISKGRKIPQELISEYVTVCKMVGYPVSQEFLDVHEERLEGLRRRAGEDLILVYAELQAQMTDTSHGRGIKLEPVGICDFGAEDDSRDLNDDIAIFRAMRQSARDEELTNKLSGALREAVHLGLHKRNDYRVGFHTISELCREIGVEIPEENS